MYTVRDIHNQALQSFTDAVAAYEYLFALRRVGSYVTYERV